MANTTLTADIIAKEAVMILENQCVMGSLVYRGYEEEFSNSVNGYKKGETISIKKPTDFTVRDGAVAAVPQGRPDARGDAARRTALHADVLRGRPDGPSRELRDGGARPVPSRRDQARPVGRPLE